MKRAACVALSAAALACLGLTPQAGAQTRYAALSTAGERVWTSNAATLRYAAEAPSAYPAVGWCLALDAHLPVLHWSCGAIVRVLGSEATFRLSVTMTPAGRCIALHRTSPVRWVS